MKGNKFKITNDKGITLIALVITIVIMIIIVGISVYTGIDTLDNTKLQAFYTELGIIQKRVDDIMTTNESYIEDSGKLVYLKDAGVAYASLNSDKKNALNSIMQSEGADLGLTATSFRYFTTRDLEDILNLRNMEHNVFIHFASRTIISEQGVTVNGVTYHVLKNQLYFTAQNTDKNKGTISLSSTPNIIQYGTNNYKIVLSLSRPIGDLTEGGILRYKKTTSKYWETSNSLEFVISKPITNSYSQEYIESYEIIYQDKNKNTLSTTIKIKFDANGENPTISEY